MDNSTATAYKSPIQRWMWVVFAFACAAVVVLTVAFAPIPAAASVGDTIKEWIATALAAIVSVVGKLLLGAVYILTSIAKYNGFIEADAVKNGWVIVRDLANMFFIVVLLIIAFATILNVSSYQWKAMLPQLLIAAILINFSKTIAGLLIDLSQVVTLTFVNGFAASAGGNFANMYQIQGLLSLDPNQPGGVGLLDILGGYILAFVLVSIALVVTLIMAVIFAFRIVMLWALVVLSPLPYLLNVLPQGKKYGDKWWSMFGEYLTVGPVLAFFLWLALVSVGSGDVGQQFVSDPTAEYDQVRQVAGSTQAAEPKSLISFVIAICMLIAGLKITGEMGVIGAGAAKGALGKMEGMAKWGAKKFTGYRAVSERVSGVMAAREQARKEKVGDSVAAWQGRVGLVQQGIGTAMGGIGIAAGHLAFGRRAAAADKRADGLQRQKAAAQDAGKWDDADRLERQAIAAKGEAASLRKKQRWTERGVNAGVVGGLAAVTGGVGLVAAPALLGRGIADAGKKQREDAQQHKYKKMNAERDAVKNLKPGDILSKAQGGPGVSSAEQMAAIITAVEKQLVPPSELQGLRRRLEGLKPDDKTLSTFDSIAGQKYAGTPLARKPMTDEEKKTYQEERQRRLRTGQVSMKDVPDAELTADGGSFSADIALHAAPEDRKELMKSKARKSAYQAGLKDAIGKETDVDNKAKLQSAAVQAGLDPQEAYGADLAAFGSALAGKEGGSMLAALDVSRLQDATWRNAVKANASPQHLKGAMRKAYDDNDGQRAQEISKMIDEMIDELSGRPELQTVDRWRTDVKQREDGVGTARQHRTARRGDADRLTQVLAGAAPGSAEHARVSRQLTEAQRQLDEAERALRTEEQNLRSAQEDLREEEERSKELIGRRTQLRNLRKNA